MADSVKLTYQEMKDNCGSLKTYAEQYAETASSVTTLVGTFTGSWEGVAEQKFEEDYTTLTNAMNTAINTMNEITALVESYVNDMQEIESAYGTNHVSVG